MNFSRLIPKQRSEQRGRSTQRDILPKAVRNATIGAIVSESETPVIDERGLVSQNNFITSVVSVAGGFNQEITADTDTDITNASLTFTTERTTLFMFQADIITYMINGGVGDYLGHGVTKLYLDTTELNRTVEYGGVIGGESYGCGGTILVSSSMHRWGLVSAGTRTVKLTALRDVGTGTPTYKIYKYRLSYIELGA